MKNSLLTVSFLMLTFTALAQPQFKGGDRKLSELLSNSLIYPEYAKQNCISGTVQVSFNVDQAGKVSHVKVYKGLGVDLDDEAVRVVRLTSGKWVVPPGHNKNESIILPVKFNTDPTRCQNADRQSIEQAINAYRQRQALVNAVTNYYSNKYEGKADSTKEQVIINLKAQLGFDDEFAAEILKQANAKLKQGDTEGACEDWLFIRNIGSDIADGMLSRYCH